jgi:hypothetical protein
MQLEGIYDYQATNRKQDGFLSFRGSNRYVALTKSWRQQVQ